MSVNDGKSRILAGITEDAEKEAQKIIEEATKMAQERLTLARGKADKILKDAQSKAASQADSTSAAILSGIAVEKKREKMKMQDEIMHDLLERVRSSFTAALSSDGYPAVLQRLITEAAIGLDTATMTVNASVKERPLISETMLTEIADHVENQCGHSVALSLASSPPLKEQGVVVTAKDGRTAFNNCMSTRMRRFEQIIRNRVYDTLFTDMKSVPEPIRQTEQS